MFDLEEGVASIFEEAANRCDDLVACFLSGLEIDNRLARQKRYKYKVMEEWAEIRRARPIYRIEAVIWEHRPCRRCSDPHFGKACKLGSDPKNTKRRIYQAKWKAAKRAQEKKAKPAPRELPPVDRDGPAGSGGLPAGGEDDEAARTEGGGGERRFS